ncbi:MAG: hypothetical protein IKQ72_13400 [Bacteroidaceae bacterium]|nr:hypothetical protein [Bacteroidaceae bacterium]
MNVLNRLIILLLIFLAGSTLSLNAKKVKADSPILVVKKILKSSKKNSSLYRIGENIDLNVMSTGLWNEAENDTLFMFINSDWCDFVSIHTKDIFFEFHDWHEKGIRTCVSSYKFKIDYSFEKIKTWDKKMFESWKEYPKGSYDVALITAYRIIRKSQNKYEYSCYTYYDHTSIADIINSGPIIRIKDYYYK